MIRCTDEQLLDQLSSLRARERTTTLDILLYLAEVERRKLHLSLGYASMFAFATRHLRYSESAAGRRVQAARCVRNHPQLAELLRCGTVNLSTVSLVSRILNDTNKEALLARICNKSQREVEAIVAMYKPATNIRDRIQPVCVPAAKPTDPESEGTTDGLFKDNHSRSGSGAIGSNRHDDKDVRPSTSDRTSRKAQIETTENGGTHSEMRDATHEGMRAEDSGQMQIEPRFKVQFMARQEFMQKFEEARALLSGRFPRGASFEAVFEAALDAFLECKSPIQRNARRKRSAARHAAKSNGRAESNGRTKAKSHAGADNRGTKRRVVPVAVRDAVYERDGGRCTFVGVARRCDSTHDVEVDHRRPVAHGGSNDIDNLRLLCSMHNRLEAERVFGAAWMQHFQ